jgi:hypothetical protein
LQPLAVGRTGARLASAQRFAPASLAPWRAAALPRRMC